ncbi:hypothetical protein ECZU12_55420 [Escherichia coli]|nr:hypothetical protein ECZU12_55420 [Escherichia coli]
MNIIKQQGGMFGPNKNISEWCIPQNEENPKTRDKTSLKLGIAIPQNRGHKRHYYKRKRKIIRPRILANPLTSQKTIFLWLNRMLQFRAAAVGNSRRPDRRRVDV